MIEIDGSYKEGGGQILRTALALSTLTGKSFRITDIRKGRPKPGFKAQHLHCVNALKKICNAQVSGAELGSTTLEFSPGKIISGKYEIDIETAGSITLLLQSVLLPLMFAVKRSVLRIKGGTDVAWSMPADYFKNVFLPHIQKFASVQCNTLKRGYYPRGNGEVEIVIKPKFNIYDEGNIDYLIRKVQETIPAGTTLIEPGAILQIKGISHAAMFLQNSDVVKRQADAARQELIDFRCPLSITEQYADALSPGSGITLWGLFGREETDFNNPIILGADALGERGKPAEIVGKEAAKKLIKEINSEAAVDEHLADNLIPFLIFGGKIKTSKITDHCLSNIYVVQKFLGEIFVVDEEKKFIEVKS